MITPEQQPTTDPRKKDGIGLDYWAEGLLKAGLIKPSEYEYFLRQNNSKEDNMKNRNLPQLKHYGIFKSIEQIRKKIKPENEDRFIIRCSSKKDGSIKRLIDTDFEGVCGFASKLPGGFDDWIVEVKEFAKSIIAGTIIVTPSGSVSIETWEGPHYLNTTNIKKYHAEFNPDQFDLHYKWSSYPQEESFSSNTNFKMIQEYAIQALKYVFPYLKPKEDEQIYLEYGVKENGQVYFIEANDSTVLTGK